ncbi:MAG: hypothetical protein A3J06_03550 [Candidatus Moranbacteria bacterium RIFCSPLOWO2_02_FULL_48_19]|nr:MAG: hypothetical protein A3J06_03550 [Candidatus Moranbacteria bacterium RIFCSPLOWO2_02_FULL_48_19]OGI30835.1 MAG: hypothetical protein A3G09_03565 [Candidatus Moranbacteria bacterium RIFCSPLOWO2_12_FULL_48_12]
MGTMDKFRFLNWEMYNDAQDLFSIVLKVVRDLPKEYRFEFGSQIIRSCLSVVLNIAEGSGKSSDRELNRYFDIALGSLFEVLASVDTLKRNKLLTESEFSDIFQRVDHISNQIGGFKRSISRRKS